MLPKRASALTSVGKILSINVSDLGVILVWVDICGIREVEWIY